MVITKKELEVAIEKINNGDGVGWNSPFKILYVSGLQQRLEHFIYSGIIDLTNPFTCAIEPSLECENKCGFCSFTDRNMTAKQVAQTWGQTAVNLTADSILEIRDAIIAAKSAVCWGGGGESLFWRDPSKKMPRKETNIWLRRIIQDLGDNMIPMSLVSNFVSANDFLTVIMQYMTYCMINVPSTNSQVYHDVTGTRNLQRVLDNIGYVIHNREKFADERNKRGLHPFVKIDIRTVVNLQNVESLLRTAQDLIGMGVDFAGFRCAGDFEEVGTGICERGKQSLRDYMINNAPQIALLNNGKTNLAKLLGNNGEMTLLIDGSSKDATQCWVQKFGLRSVFAPNGVYPCTQFVGRDITPQNDSMWSAGNPAQATISYILGSTRHSVVINLLAKIGGDGTCPQIKNCSQGFFNGVIQLLIDLIRDGQTIFFPDELSPEFRQSRLKDDGYFI